MNGSKASDTSSKDSNIQMVVLRLVSIRHVERNPGIRRKARQNGSRFNSGARSRSFSHALARGIAPGSHSVVLLSITHRLPAHQPPIHHHEALRTRPCSLSWMCLCRTQRPSAFGKSNGAFTSPQDEALAFPQYEPTRASGSVTETSLAIDCVLYCFVPPNKSNDTALCSFL